MRVLSKLLFVAIILAAVRLPAGAVTITANLTATPANYSGACPTVIKFTGTVSATNWSATALKQVQFKFTRSDGALSPTQTLDFSSGPSSRPVSTTWTLGGPGMNYSGWEAIHIVYPQALDSNHADFAIKCEGKPVPTTSPTQPGRTSPPPPRLNIETHLAVRPASAVQCPYTFHFFGTITTGPWPPTALRRVDYKFERSDGAFAPVHSIMFPAAGGSQTVTDTWTLSLTYSGWEQIHIIYPQDLLFADRGTR
jgi:hypothetical protein